MNSVENRTSNLSVIQRLSGMGSNKSENASVALDLVQQIKRMNMMSNEDLRQKKIDGRLKKLSFLKAWLVPGVILYAFTSFCLKFGVGSILQQRYTWISEGLDMEN